MVACFGPGNGPVHGEQAFQVAGDADHTLAVRQLDRPREYFLRQRQRGLHDDGVYRPGFVGGDDLESLLPVSP